MGQFGALGYASNFGWNESQILNHYYSNTASASLGGSPLISVWLTGQDSRDLTITAGVPFTAAGIAVPAGGAARIATDHLNHYWVAVYTACGGPETAVYAVDPGQVSVYPGTGRTYVAAQPTTGDPGQDLARMLKICDGPFYRGWLAFLSDGTTQKTTNVIDTENYLRSSVPREVPSSWPSAALRAQAVAARSYSLSEGGEAGNRFWWAKTCDSTLCQVYGGAAGPDGVRREAATTDAAIGATAGVVRRFGNGALARTEYSSSTGGWTAGGEFPAVQDLGDAVAANTRHTWTTTLSVASIEAKYGIGTLLGINITSRNGLGEWGGRVKSLQVIGSTNTVALTGNQFRFDWGLFSDWFITNGMPEEPAGPSAATRVNGRLDLFMTNAEGVVFHAFSGTGGMSAWERVGGSMTASVDVASWGPGRFDVLGRGRDGAIWHTASSGGPWPNFYSLGGTWASGPGAVSWGPNRVDVFARTLDNQVWSKAWTGTAWSPWYGLGGSLRGDPDAASWGAGRIDLFTRGTDGAIWSRVFNGTAWGPWYSLGGQFTSSPSAVSWGPNRIDVFARGVDNQLWSKAWTPAGWSAWYPLGGTMVSAADAASQTTNKLDVVVLGTDGQLWQRSFNGTGWVNWFPIGKP